MSNGMAGDQSSQSIYTNHGMTMYGGAGFVGELSDSDIMTTNKVGANGNKAKDPLVKSVK